MRHLPSAIVTVGCYYCAGEMSAAYSVRDTHEDVAKGTRYLPVAAVAMAAAVWAMVVLDRKKEEIKARAKNRRYLHPRATWEHQNCTLLQITTKPSYLFNSCSRENPPFCSEPDRCCMIRTQTYNHFVSITGLEQEVVELMKH
jgi:hypothetical protein